MIDLYTARTPNTQKIHIMIEETGLEYREIRIDIGKGDQFTPEYLKINPNNKVPTIVDHDRFSRHPSPSLTLVKLGKKIRLSICPRSAIGVTQS